MKPVDYTQAHPADQTDAVMKPPFDGQSYEVDFSKGWCSAWWNREAGAWVCKEGLFNQPLKAALYWREIGQ